MTTNKPEIIGYVPTKDGKLRCGEDGFCLNDYTDQLRDNPAGLKLEPVILFRDYEALQHELEMYKSAFNEWLEKSKWVQETAVPKELGMHRADVMKSRIEVLQAECDKLRKDAELWESIHDDIHRRADKEHALADKCDFNVTIMYDDYAAIDTAIKGETE